MQREPHQISWNDGDDLGGLPRFQTAKAEEFSLTLRKMGSIDSDGVDASGVGEARISSEGYLCRHDASRKLVCHIGCIRAHIIGL